MRVFVCLFVRLFVLSIVFCCYFFCGLKVARSERLSVWSVWLFLREFLAVFCFARFSEWVRRPPSVFSPHRYCVERLCYGPSTYLVPLLRPSPVFHRTCFVSKGCVVNGQRGKASNKWIHHQNVSMQYMETMWWAPNCWGASIITGDHS